jgi:hypothetical protein
MGMTTTWSGWTVRTKTRELFRGEDGAARAVLEMEELWKKGYSEARGSTGISGENHCVFVRMTPHA